MMIDGKKRCRASKPGLFRSAAAGGFQTSNVVVTSATTTHAPFGFSASLTSAPDLAHVKTEMNDEVAMKGNKRMNDRHDRLLYYY